MKRCTPAAAAASFSLILAVPALLLHLGADAAMAVFAAAAVSTAAAMALGVPWGEIEETILRVVADCIPTLLIVILVGMLVGIWMAGGTVPALLYYGVRLIAPGTLVPLAFLLCLLCAEFTGTSFGSVAAMGLTMAGIAATTSVPPALVAGAVVSGAWFGDKMSPLSDTTNLASAVSRVPLYDHIGSMAYTSLPAAALSLWRAWAGAAGSWTPARPRRSVPCWKPTSTCRPCCSCRRCWCCWCPSGACRRCWGWGSPWRPAPCSPWSASPSA